MVVGHDRARGIDDEAGAERDALRSALTVAAVASKRGAAKRAAAKPARHLLVLAAMLVEEAARVLLNRGGRIGSAGSWVIDDLLLRGASNDGARRAERAAGKMGGQAFSVLSGGLIRRNVPVR